MTDTKDDEPEANGKLKRKEYERELARLHVEFVKLQQWIVHKGLKVCILFEGRDGAGKGGTIKAMTERVSPRIFRVVALPAPTEREKSQMYAQRYLPHMPAAGEVVIFDRSWYNRAGVERVMGFCTEDQVKRFLEMVPAFEKVVVDDGIILLKYWLEVSPDEQTRRLEARIDDGRKTWKLSDMDLKSYSRWYDYSRACDEMDRFRDPALSVLLALEICLIFLAAPLAAKGAPIARPIIETMVLAVVVIVGLLSHRRIAIAAILLGLAATLTSRSVGSAWPPIAAGLFHRGGDILTFAALTWVVSDAVYAPGRITLHRLQGAAVLYLNAAIMFGAAFSLILGLNPDAFAIPPATAGDLGELATMLYFSLTTLTTTGYGDIVPIGPFARSLANLEAVIGPFYLAITVARLVTLELEDRRR
jgi:polyphosphate kinase 2